MSGKRRFWYTVIPSGFKKNNYEEICSLLRTFLAVPQADLEPPDAILERFHIITKEQEILLKGCWKIRWKDFVLDTSRLRGGIAISSAGYPFDQTYRGGDRESYDD